MHVYPLAVQRPNIYRDYSLIVTGHCKTLISKCSFFSLFHCLRCSLTSIYLSLPQNQVQREIKYAMTSLPWISLPTVALFFAEVRGYSKLYDAVDESPLGMSKKVSSSVLLTFPVRLSQGVEFLMLQWCVFRLAWSFPEYDFLPVFH